MKRVSLRMRSILGIAALAVLSPVPGNAQTTNSYPMLMSVRPAAAQIGQTTEHEVSARYNLYGAYKVLVAGEGVIGEVVVPETKPGEKPPEVKPDQPKPNQPKLKVRFTVAADAVPGVRDFRIATPQGASTVGQIVVARDPVVMETGDNNTAAKAQQIALPATVCGAIEAAEDLDVFKFTVEAGTAWTFHVRAQRLEDRIHDLQTHVDPIITLRNSAGSTLATSDNYYAGDPLLYHKFDAAGEYFLEIRDVRYQGNAEWVYSIEINDRPFVTQVFPLAVAPGAETKLSLVGYNLPADPTALVSLPATVAPGPVDVSPPVGGKAADRIAVVATALPVVLEADADNNTVEMGQPVPVPAAITGRIETPGDVDCFTFEAKAGEKFVVRVIARNAASALDSNLRILNATGAVHVENDDIRVHRVNQSDSWIEEFKAPADGKFTIEIRDLHLRGGAEYVYVVEVTRSLPHFTLEVDTDKTLLAPGINAPIYVRVTRKSGFAGDVQLAVEGLPPGVSATCGRILANGLDGCIILQAAANAPAGVANVRITGTGTHEEKPGELLQLSAVGQPLQEVYNPGGGRVHYPVEVHTVSVAEPMDIRGITLSNAEISLKPGETQRIEVNIERAPEFKQNITLDVLFQHLEQPYGNSLPKGVTLDSAGSKTLLGPTETKGYITLKAAADAPPVEKQLIPVMAHVSINFVMKATYASQPVWLTVLPK